MAPQKKRGRPYLLGEELEAKLQQYLKQAQLEGGPVNLRVLVAAVRGILLAYDKSRLQEFGGHIKLWAHSLLHRMNFVQRKGATAKS